MKVNLDYREDEDVERALRNAGATPVRMKLKKGDISTDKVCIEFKRARDFIDSIIDRRLDRQLTAMPTDKKACYLLIAGTLEEVEDRHRVRLNENMIWGMLGSIAVRYQVSWHWVYRPLKQGGMSMAMYTAHKICKGVSEGKLGVPRVRPPKTKGLPAGVAAIKKAYGVPTKVARELHRKFKNLAGVANANQTRLQTVRGVGKVRAAAIYKISRA